MSIGSERSSVGPPVNFTSARPAFDGRVPCNAPVVGSSAAHVWLGSLSTARAGLLASASVEPSVVQRTRQPRATGNSFGAALSADATARGSAGTRMMPGCATPRASDIPLTGNDPARSVAVSIDVRRETSTSRSDPVPPPATTVYARPNPIHFQSGDGATSQTLSICVWKARVSSPKKNPFGTGSFSTPPGSATTRTAFLSGENIHNTRSAIPWAPRFTGVTVTTGPTWVVSAVVSFVPESTTQPARKSGKREAVSGKRETGRNGKREEGSGKRERQNQRREMSI